MSSLELPPTEDICAEGPARGDTGRRGENLASDCNAGRSGRPVCPNIADVAHVKKRAREKEKQEEQEEEDGGENNTCLPS